MTSISRVNRIIVFLITGLVCGASIAVSAELLPTGLVIETEFKPGPGEPVGKVALVQGKAVVIHKNKNQGYYAVKDLPLYKGDTLITLKRGRIQFRLNDNSTFTLASATRLVINSSVYAPEAKTRFSFFKLIYGKARFVVRKLTGFRKSDVSVKTRTAILGVRGSDFVVRATDTATEVAALDDTVLEIRSLAALEMEPTLLQDYEKVMIEMDTLPSPIEKITEAEKIELIRDLAVMPAVAARDERLEVRREEAEATADEETTDTYNVSETDETETEYEAESETEAYEEDAETEGEAAEETTGEFEDTDTAEESTETTFDETDTSVEAAGVDEDVEDATVDVAVDPDLTDTVSADVGEIDTGDTQSETQQVDTSEINDTIVDVTENAAETASGEVMPELPPPPANTCP